MTSKVKSFVNANFQAHLPHSFLYLDREAD